MGPTIDEAHSRWWAYTNRPNWAFLLPHALLFLPIAAAVVDLCTTDHRISADPPPQQAIELLSRHGESLNSTISATMRAKWDGRLTTAAPSSSGLFTSPFWLTNIVLDPYMVLLAPFLLQVFIFCVFVFFAVLSPQVVVRWRLSGVICRMWYSILPRRRITVRVPSEAVGTHDHRFSWTVSCLSFF